MQGFYRKEGVAGASLTKEKKALLLDQGMAFGCGGGERTPRVSPGRLSLFPLGSQGRVGGHVTDYLTGA